MKLNNSRRNDWKGTGALPWLGGALEVRGGRKQRFSFRPSSHKVNMRPQLNLPEEETNSLAMSKSSRLSRKRHDHIERAAGNGRLHIVDF